ncbi:alpha/beta fold hydrolase [Nesterenkonia xinjiangensis]|uniref:Pimeloyl-ACP methyl ester carboxylesterase n=1 Tax=Nesterenkonia xinjiangensis TaxID=225327 RepID=A0A7Z0GIV6_9MICC|nr:pimeloyl-ACP methyl ester carboxylesterase [Nesterenkonia xinjiangensis]
MSISADFSLHTTTVGDSGSTVVFLHGLFGQGKNFTQIAKGLTPDHQSLLVDLPNHGRSDWTEQLDYPEMADLVAEELRAGVAADQPVHLVGHSMGGKVAMVLALRHPELIDRLVVVDIAPVATGGSMGQFEHLLGSLAELDLTQISSRGEADEQLQENIADPMIRGFLLQSLVRRDGGFGWLSNLDLLRAELDVIGGFPDLTDTQFTGPVLLIAGADSDYITEEHRSPMRTLFPQTHLLRINDAGHWVHADQPEVFTSVLRHFFAHQD